MVEGDSVSMLGFTGTVDIRVLVVYLSGLVFFFQMLWTSKWNECYTETAATSPSLKIDYSPAFLAVPPSFVPSGSVQYYVLSARWQLERRREKQGSSLSHQ